MIGLNNIVPMMGKIANAGVAEGMVVTVKPSLVAPDNKIYSLDIVADAFEVDWGDGVADSSTAHTYADGDSEYTVQVTGTNITKLSQGTTITNNGRALTALLLMNLPNLTNTDNIFRQARSILDWSNLALPAGVTSLGNNAFNDCTTLALTSLPEGVTTIGNRAFYGCTSLALTSLPAGVTSIGGDAFNGCSSLADIVFLGTPNSIGFGAFKNTSVNLFVPWSEGDVAGAPWGTNGTITYNYVA